MIEIQYKHLHSFIFGTEYNYFCFILVQLEEVVAQPGIDFLNALDE